MRAELPWNVAGIPPEVREAARAAARREGLSVGEWLTRHILRSFSGLEEDGSRHLADAASEDVSSAGEGTMSLTFAQNGEPPEEEPGETGSGEAWRRIEEQLRGIGRRLDSSERSHGESN